MLSLVLVNLQEIERGSDGAQCQNFAQYEFRFSSSKRQIMPVPFTVYSTTKDRLCLCVLLPTVQQKQFPRSFYANQVNGQLLLIRQPQFCCYWHFTSYGHHCWICVTYVPDEAVCVIHVFLNCSLLESWRLDQYGSRNFGDYPPI
jgi:hypothetical protein